MWVWRKKTALLQAARKKEDNENNHWGPIIPPSVFPPEGSGLVSSRPRFLSDHSQLPPRLLEATQDLIQLLLRVGRHVTCPEEFSSWGDCRANDRIDKDTIFEEELAHLVSFHGVFNKDGNDRSFARSCIIPERFVSF